MSCPMVVKIILGIKVLASEIYAVAKLSSEINMVTDIIDLTFLVLNAISPKSSYVLCFVILEQ